MAYLVQPEAQEGDETKRVNQGRPVNDGSESEVTAALVALGEEADDIAAMSQEDRVALLKEKYSFTVGEL